MTKKQSPLPDWTKLLLKKEPSVEIAGVVCTCHSIVMESLLECNAYIDRVCVGIDPGRNFGITYLGDDGGFVYNGTMPSAPHDLYAEKAYDLTVEFCNLYCMTAGDVSVIEGASYGDTYGQVGLAEIREGFRLALRHCGLEPVTVAPLSYRKAIFGNGRIQPMDVFPSINHNGADSVAMCLYGAVRGMMK